MPPLLARLFLSCLACMPALSLAAFPEKAVKLVVGAPPGGVTDTLGRAIGQALSGQLGVPVVVENRVGAGGVIAMNAVAEMPADGHTLFIDAVTTRVVSMHFYKDSKTDLQRGFEPVGLVANAPHLLVVRADSGLNSLDDLARRARESSAPLTFASQGTGTLSHLESELLAQQLGIRMTHVPYRGSAPAQVDLIGGQVDLMFDSVASAIPQMQAGRLRTLGIASARRIAALDAPTLQEAGLQGYVAENWFGIFAPRGTPSVAIERLSAALRASLDDKALVERMFKLGVNIGYGGPAVLRDTLQSDVERWGAVVKEAGLDTAAQP